MVGAAKLVRATAANKWLVLGVLMLVGLTNYIDRLSISILQVPIKAELGLSDTQLGAMTGLSFSLVYTLAAIPLARLADRISPKLVIVACLIIWNALTMLCGLAGSFLALAFLRMGVAIGEAGCGPPTQALLSRYFPAHQRARAIALWQMVFPLGTLLGIFGSGMLSAVMGWRHAFMVIGFIGLLVVPLLLLVLKDPLQARPADANQARDAGPAGTFEALRHLLSFRSYRLLLIGGFFATVPLQALLNWNAPFYGRVFALPIEQVTFIVAMTAGVGGIIGIFMGGLLSDILGKKDQRWYCWLPALAVLFVPAFAALQFLIAPTPTLSLFAGVVCGILLNCWMPPQAAVGQLVVEHQNRALAAACILVTGGLGAALGPFLTGLISDFLRSVVERPGDELAWAIWIVSLSAVLAAAFFLKSGVHLRQDLQTVVRQSEISRQLGAGQASAA